MIVRDHFLHDPIYHWHDVAEELPHAITQAMIFKPDVDMTVQLLDIGTLFTKPANYLPYLKGAAVYARDRWDIPVNEIRRLDEEEMKLIVERCEGASSRLYKRIATMSPRDRIMAGATTYYAEFVAPWARAAGVWDDLVENHDFFELDQVASEVYYPLVKEKKASTLIPEQFLMGTGYPRIPEQAPPVDPVHYPVLHAIALRGAISELPEGAAELESAGLIVGSGDTYMLSETGQAAHDALLEEERGQIDAARLGGIYERFLKINTELKTSVSRWQSAKEDERDLVLAELADILQRVTPVLRRSGEIVPRIADYAPRLQSALDQAEAGDGDWVTSPRIDSIHTVWMELHEDYIQVLGRDREQEGSF